MSNKYRKLFCNLVLLITLVYTLVSCSDKDSDSQQIADSTNTVVSAKAKISFNEIVYNQVYHQFVAAGGNHGKAFLITSPDGLAWKKHEINQIGIITSLIVSDNGRLYYDLEIPGTTDSAVYRINNPNYANTNWKTTLLENYKSYERVVKSIKNYQAIYELRTIDNKIFRVYRILINPNSTVTPELIYTGKDITDIECNEDDSSVLLLFKNKEIMASKSPSIPNSFIPANPIKIESGIMSETIASGIHLVSKIRLKNKESNIVEIYYAFNNKTNTWKEIKRLPISMLTKDEFSADINLNYESDTYVDVDRATNNIPQLVTGSITSNGKFVIESYPDNLPPIAQRTCAAGAIINGENVIIIMGDDNKILRSRDNKNWQIITLQ